MKLKIIIAVLSLSFAGIASAGKLDDRVSTLEAKVAALEALTACNGSNKYYTVNVGTTYSVRIVTNSCGHVLNAYSVYNGGGDGGGPDGGADGGYDGGGADGGYDGGGPL